MIFIRQNKGTLSRRRRQGEFSQLRDEEVTALEAIARDAFEGFEDEAGEARGRRRRDVTAADEPPPGGNESGAGNEKVSLRDEAFLSSRILKQVSTTDCCWRLTAREQKEEGERRRPRVHGSPASTGSADTSSLPWNRDGDAVAGWTCPVVEVLSPQ